MSQYFREHLSVSNRGAPNPYADINIDPRDLPAEVHLHVADAVAKNGVELIRDRIVKILTDDAFDTLPLAHALALSHVAQFWLILDARLGLAVQQHSSTKALFGPSLDLHAWLYENTSFEPDSWYRVYTNWMENLPEELLSFQRGEKNAAVHLHHLLLDYAVTRDLIYPRPPGVVWSPVPNIREFGFRFDVDPEKRCASVSVANYRIPENSCARSQEADLRLWIPVFARFQIQYAYRVGSKWRMNGHFNVGKDTSSANTGSFRVRRITDAEIARNDSARSQFALRRPMTALNFLFDNFCKEQPDAWLAFAEVVYMRTAALPASKEDVFRNLNELKDIPVENLAYYILGNYRPLPDGVATPTFGWI